MHPKSHRCAHLYILAALTAVSLLSPRHSAAQSYTVTNLGSLGGGYTVPFAINNVGQVVGYSETAAGNLDAFLWQNGVMTNLGTLGGSGSIATGINNVGQVVGYSFTAGNPDAFLWQNGVMTNLGSLGGGESLATGINNAGQVVGYSYTAAGQDAFLWQNGVMTNLGTLGGSQTIATGINNAGQVVGYSYTAAGNYDADAFLWQNGVMTNLVTLGGSESFATGINNAGQVVGYSNTAANNRNAFLWQNGVMTNLGTLGGSVSLATGVNNAGQVVGYSVTAAGNYDAFLWQNGVMTDLSSLIPAGSGWVIAPGSSTFINDAGQIAGYGLYNGSPAGYLLSPSVSGRKFKTLYSFTGLSDGSFPRNLVQGADGWLYGATAFGGTSPFQNGAPYGGGTIFKIRPDGSGFTTLYSNLGVQSISLGPDGTIYAASVFGNIPDYQGCIFKAKKDGSSVVPIYYFPQIPVNPLNPLDGWTYGPNGNNPTGAPIPGPAGDNFLYGITGTGGATADYNPPYGGGVVYKLAMDGSSFQLLHVFDPVANAGIDDGAAPVGSLTLGSDGFLYGATLGGGISGVGTVFKISRDGTIFQTLNDFTTGPYAWDAELPWGGVIQGTNGLLYGATTGGSISPSGGGLYGLATDGTGYSVLAGFPDWPFLVDYWEQCQPNTVVQGQDGNLYGSTEGGGGTGQLYRVLPNGAGYTILYNFSAQVPSISYTGGMPGGTNLDGAYPLNTMIAANGKLYGTAPVGGAYGFGTIFELDLNLLGPPKTTMTLAGPAGANGWYVGPVQVSFSATDPSDNPGSPGSAVTATYYIVDGGTQQAYTTGQSITVTGDARHSITYWSVDFSGNAEVARTAVVKIDASPPTVTFDNPSPHPNAAGWNNSLPVTLAFHGVDPISGVANLVPASPLTFSSAGIGQTQTVTVTDNAGNTASYVSPPVNIDMTPPVTTASSSGADPVTVTLSATDDLSGVKVTHYYITKADGTVGGTKAYSAPFNITDAGTNTLTYWSVDNAGNVETANILTIQVIPTPNIQLVVTTSVDTNGQAEVYVRLQNTGTAPASNVYVGPGNLVYSNYGRIPVAVEGYSSGYIGTIAVGATSSIFDSFGYGVENGNGLGGAFNTGQVYQFTCSGTYGSTNIPWSSTINVTMP